MSTRTQHFIYICKNYIRVKHDKCYKLWFGSVGSVVDRINEGNQDEARLVLGWVTIPVCDQPPRSTRPGHPSVGRCIEYQQKLECKQAHHAMHWPHIRGLAV